MSDIYDEIRDEWLQHFATHAAQLFERYPRARSLLLSVAHYWDERVQAHGEAVISARDVPVWPHECPRWSPAVTDDTDFLDDPGARTLYTEGTPVVRGEYCMPLGEALSLCLAPRLDDAARARRDELIATHRDRWLHPLGALLAHGCAHLDRGILRTIDVHADDAARHATLGAPAWIPVETIRIAPGSVDVVDPAMVSLRDIGPLRLDGVRMLADAPARWAIERLHVRVMLEQRDRVFDALIAADTLPRLRELALSIPAPSGSNKAAIGRLVDAPWWRGLARLTLVVPSFDDREAVRSLLPLVPRDQDLAIAELGPHGQPAGWQLVLDHHRPGRVELSMVGWHARATIDQLRGLLDALPDRELVLVSSRYRQWLPDDLALLPDRNVRLEATP